MSHGMPDRSEQRGTPGQRTNCQPTFLCTSGRAAGLGARCFEGLPTSTKLRIGALLLPRRPFNVWRGHICVGENCRAAKPALGNREEFILARYDANLSYSSPIFQDMGCIQKLRRKKGVY